MSDGKNTGNATAGAAGRVAVVTGAGRYIGAEIARRLAERGYAVAVNDLVGERAEAVVGEIKAAGGKAMTAVADVTDLSAVERMEATVRAELGPVSVLVNNAGVPDTFIPRQFLDMPVEDWDKFLKLNLYGVMHCARAFGPSMRESGWGRIVTIVSEAWRTGTDMGIALYGAGKAGAIGFSRHLAAELGPNGVTVNCIALGEMDNLGMPESMKARYPTRRFGTPGDVAGTVDYLCSDDAEWVTGQTLALSGGLMMA